MSEAWLTIEQAAKRAEVSAKTVKKWIKRGLPVSDHGPRLRRIRVEALDRWLREFEVASESTDVESSGTSKNQPIEKTRISTSGNFRYRQ